MIEVSKEKRMSWGPEMKIRLEIDEGKEEEEIVITVEKEKQESKPKKGNIFTNWFDKFGRIIEEGENDE